MTSTPPTSSVLPESKQSKTVPVEAFYSSHLKAGSSHMAYIPPDVNRGETTRVHRRASSSPPPPLADLDTVLNNNHSDSDLPALVPADEHQNIWNNENSGWLSTLYSSLPSNVTIDGRDEKEEQNWWDPKLREQQGRPGRGILPVLIQAQLLGGDVTLYKIKVNRPTPLASTSSENSPSSDLTSNDRKTPIPALLPLTDDDLTAGVLHPDALYNAERNEWRIVITMHGELSHVSRDLSEVTSQIRLPDDYRRISTLSCVGVGGYGQTNLCHHLHLYSNIVRGHHLEPPLQQVSYDKPIDDLLDLLVCCQCSFYCIVSKPIPGVVPVVLLNRLVNDKIKNPSVDLSGPDCAAKALDMIVKATENNVWKGETRGLSISGKAFQRLGWDANVAEIFKSLKYTLPDQAEEKPAVKPPSMASHDDRILLLRAWIELSCYLAVFIQRNNLDWPGEKTKCWVELQDMTSNVNDSFGIQPSNEIVRSFVERPEWQNDWWNMLGLPPDILSADLIEFAYRSQSRCDPAKTSHYLTCVKSISSGIRYPHLDQVAALDGLIATEISRGRWTRDHLYQAASALGFGKDNDLKLEWNDEIEDDFAINAWKDAVRRAWSEHINGAQRRKELNEAFRVLAEDRESAKMMQELRDNALDMDPDQAYRILEVPRDVDEDMLLMVFNMRVEEQPSQVERMKRAMMVIVEFTDSARLRLFMQTGIDGVQTPERPFEWPRGLNQLGNTCYLNSLLQYFYTIKELREAVAPLRTFEQGKVEKDDLSSYRVGGRLVSRKEIYRSQAFVSQLANLFADLESSGDPSVTPSIELAKLALITSKDEEDDELSTRPDNTDSSNSTDATLVEEPLPVALQNSTLESPSTILGKRGRSEPSSIDNACASDVDVDMDAANYSQPIQQPPPLPPRRKTDGRDASVMMFGRQHDVAECMDNCLFQIEAALLSSTNDTDVVKSPRGLVKSLFYGKLRQRVTPVEHESKPSGVTHMKDDVFSHLPVNVSQDNCDLYDGLAAYFEDAVEFEGQRAQMDVSLVELPPILQIQLQRVQFDRKSSQAFKSHAFVKFPDILVMDRFLENIDTTKRNQSRALQRELTHCRDRLARLTTGEFAPFDEHLSTSSALLKHMNDIESGDLPSVLEAEREGLTLKTEELRHHVKLCKEQMEELWSSERQMEYELTSVFIHRGISPSWGHYFFYTRHLPESPASWFKLNDSEVSVVSKDEVFADSTNSTANAYLLVYAKKGSGVIDLAKRHNLGKTED